MESAAAAVVVVRRNHQIRAQQQAGTLSLAISRQRPLLLTHAVNEMPWWLHAKDCELAWVFEAQVDDGRICCAMLAQSVADLAPADDLPLLQHCALTIRIH